MIVENGKIILSSNNKRKEKVRKILNHDIFKTDPDLLKLNIKSPLFSFTTNRLYSTTRNNLKGNNFFTFNNNAIIDDNFINREFFFELYQAKCFDNNIGIIIFCDLM